MLPPPFTLQATAANFRGQDFVVGDIHGRFDRLQAALNQINFDPRVDRLFSVGDLLDRDPRSALALDWLRQPWFKAILGNHELLYLHWRSLRHDLRKRANFEEKQYFLPQNGGAWVADHTESLHGPLEEALGKLPTLRALATREGETLLLVHAQLPDGCRWPQMLTDDWPAARRDELAWGRSRWLSRETAPAPHIPGVAAVVVGHTTVRTPTVLGSMLYLDTGAWRSPPHGGFSVWSLDQILTAVRQSNPGVTGTSLPPASPAR